MDCCFILHASKLSDILSVFKRRLCTGVGRLGAGSCPDINGEAGKKRSQKGREG